MPSQTEKPALTPEKKWFNIKAGIVIVFFTLAPVGCTMANLNHGGASDWEPTTREARGICEDWVRDKLKAPATAHFQDGAESGAAGRYTIAGTVDAENSFGADVRTSWSCTINYSDSDEKWHGSATLL